jgi:hypothetical protein
MPAKSCGKSNYCFAGKCQKISDEKAREENDDDKFSNEDKNAGSVKCLYSCQGDFLLKRCFDEENNPTTVSTIKCAQGCEKNSCKKGGSRTQSDCQYTCDKGALFNGTYSYLKKVCKNDNGFESMTGISCKGKDCSKCFADQSQFPKKDKKDEDGEKDKENIIGDNNTNNKTKSNNIGSTTKSLENQTSVDLSGSLSKPTMFGSSGGKPVNQKMTINSSSIITSKEVEGGFQLTQEASQDWEFAGGEDNSPLALWTSEGQTINDLKNNKESFSQSRRFNYSMICESLDCEVIEKPSYVEVLNTFKNGNQCTYDLRFKNSAPSDEEFELTFNKEAKCQFEIRDETNSESITSKMKQTPNEQNYNFKGVYVGVVPQLDGEFKSSSYDGNSVEQDSLRLRSLVVDGYDLIPQFNPDYSYYSVDLVQVISDVNILAEPEDPMAMVEIEHFSNLLGSNNSSKTAYVSVISADGKKRKTYSIIFNLKKNKAYLSALSSSLAEVMPEFKKEVNNYQVDLSKQKELLVDKENVDTLLKSIGAIPADSSHLINITALDFEPNKYFSALVNVSSQNGLKSGNYYLTFYADQRMWHF